jgi:hypothetical protein
MRITITIKGLPKGAKVETTTAGGTKPRVKKYKCVRGMVYNRQGKEYRIYESDRGRHFIFRKAKKGDKYRYYIEKPF